MREFKVGEKIVLEVQEVEPWSNLCIGCFFFFFLVKVVVVCPLNYLVPKDNVLTTQI